MGPTTLLPPRSYAAVAHHRQKRATLVAALEIGRPPVRLKLLRRGGCRPRLLKRQAATHPLQLAQHGIGSRQRDATGDAMRRIESAHIQCTVDHFDDDIALVAQLKVVVELQQCHSLWGEGRPLRIVERSSEQLPRRCRERRRRFVVEHERLAPLVGKEST